MSASPDQQRIRRAGRVLVLDSADRLLLLHGFDPARPERRYWFTIGGGLDDGETAADAAIRELWEEAGIAADACDLAGPVWQRDAEFSFAGISFHQHEEYYVLHVGEVVVSMAEMEEIERETVVGYRWWSRAEIAETSDLVFPPELPQMLERLAAEPGGSV